MTDLYFLTEDFLLDTDVAGELYHNYAADLPIYDYHCHLPPAQVAPDTQWDNLAQIWLYGDHYKWRAMRTNGVDERFCTGDASDWEKFQAWAATIPYTLRNPLYHWTTWNSNARSASASCWMPTRPGRFTTRLRPCCRPPNSAPAISCGK